jgi:hypothetical protein
MTAAIRLRSKTSMISCHGLKHEKNSKESKECGLNLLAEAARLRA